MRYFQNCRSLQSSLLVLPKIRFNINRLRNFLKFGRIYFNGGLYLLRLRIEMQSYKHVTFVTCFSERRKSSPELCKEICWMELCWLRFFSLFTHNCQSFHTISVSRYPCFYLSSLLVCQQRIILRSIKIKTNNPLSIVNAIHS